MKVLPADLAASVSAVLKHHGQACLGMREALGTVVEDRGRDIKLVADRQLETGLIRDLQALLPLPAYGEEGGWSGPLPAEDAPYWLIDPLDGSYNYWRGGDAFCIAVAICRGRTPLFGAVYHVAKADCYTGGTELAARCNGRPIAVSAAASADRACLMTGLPLGGRFDAGAMAAFATGLSGWKKVRMIGSAALSLMEVATGRADFYREDGIYWWDVAAGLAIVQAAGGRFAVAGAAAIDSPLFVAAGGPALLRTALPTEAVPA